MVGIEAVNLALGEAISNCPNVHRRVLEIEGAGEAAEMERVGWSFHFSEENDGDYWFCYLSKHRKNLIAVTQTEGK